MKRIILKALLLYLTIFLISCEMESTEGIDSDSDVDTDTDTDTDADTDTDTDTDTDSDADTDTDTDSDTSTGLEEDQITATFTVPEEFELTYETMAGYLYVDFPPSGMPVAVVFNDPSPVIGPDNPYELVTGQGDGSLEGDYYFVAVLYIEGGGGGTCPVVGIDWVGVYDEAVTIGPGTGSIDLGIIELERYT